MHERLRRAYSRCYLSSSFVLVLRNVRRTSENRVLKTMSTAYLFSNYSDVYDLCICNKRNVQLNDTNSFATRFSYVKKERNDGSETHLSLT